MVGPLWDVSGSASLGAVALVEIAPKDNKENEDNRVSYCDHLRFVLSPSDDPNSTSIHPGNGACKLATGDKRHMQRVLFGMEIDKSTFRRYSMCVCADFSKS